MGGGAVITLNALPIHIRYTDSISYLIGQSIFWEHCNCVFLNLDLLCYLNLANALHGLLYTPLDVNHPVYNTVEQSRGRHVCVNSLLTAFQFTTFKNSWIFIYVRFILLLHAMPKQGMEKSKLRFVCLCYSLVPSIGSIPVIYTT